MLKACEYHFAVAAFQARPSAACRAGSARSTIGRPLVTLAEMKAPPKKPRPAWSKLSLLKSSIVMPSAPAPMNGLNYLSSKKTVHAGRDLVTVVLADHALAGRRVVGLADARQCSSMCVLPKT